MRIVVLGATGRVGSEIVRLAQQAGHAVTAFVRDPARLHAPSGVHVVIGDLATPQALTAALASGIDAVLNAVGADPLKPSTLVTDTARVVIAAMQATGVRRYIAVSGTANMPRQTLAGKVTVALMSLTPVRHAIRDHRGAFALIQASTLHWSLAGCPWIKDGPVTAAYAQSEVFPGGFKSIANGDVAHFLVSRLDTNPIAQAPGNAITCIWKP